uniref:hypothetical protein n=1 Tax=Gemmiger formicilis TaxID=745368 RepID=UPI003FEE527E
MFAVQHQVHLAVSYSEIVTQINSAPIKKSQSYRLDDLIAAKERELTKITRYKQSLYQDWKDGEITQQEYRDMKADYERQTSDISAVLTRLNAERAELANGVDNEHPALVAFMKYQNIEALNREILVELAFGICSSTTRRKTAASLFGGTIMKNAMQLKAIMKKLAKENQISAQLVLQNYILERFLERVSLSKVAF